MRHGLAHYPALLEKVQRRVNKADAAKPCDKRKRRQSTWAARFLRSAEWKAARQECLARMGSTCVLCGSGTQINVDHIKPKTKYKHLALEQANLRPLCWPCNRKKGARDDVD